MVTKVGRDVFGEGTRRNYREQGIATTYVMDDERFSGVAPIFVDDSAQNFIVIIPGANLGLSPADARNAASIIHSADIPICQLEVPVETTLEAFRVGKAKGVRTILTPLRRRRSQTNCCASPICVFRTKRTPRPSRDRPLRR